MEYADPVLNNTESYYGKHVLISAPVDMWRRKSPSDTGKVYSVLNLPL